MNIVKKLRQIFICLLFLCGFGQFVFSQDMESRETIKRGLIGSGEVLLSNGIVILYNIIYNTINVGDPVWALPNVDAIKENLTEPWEWEDTDGYKVNQLGHPIQGSIYYNAGRVNGFNFYESVFFSALGSSTWEAFAESNKASINDFITTTIGSFSLGEILYRLYLEAYAAGIPAPLAALFNPTAGVHQLITRWKPPDYGRNLYQLQYIFGTGYAKTNSSILDGSQEMFSFRGPFADIGLSVIYGNPFDQNTNIPFEHFEFVMSFGLDASNYLNIRLITDGYLFSFSPIYTDKDMMSTGLSLHMDFVSLGKFEIHDGAIDHYSNALDWTIKYQHLFSGDFSFQAKLHSGFTFLGVSEYYSLHRGKDLKNYGAGLNSKLYFTLEHEKLGRLDTNVFGYILWTYPGTSALSRGTVYWLFTDAAYSRFITKRLSIGITNFFALERGVFGDFPDTWKYNNEVKLFAAWNF